MIFLPDTGCFRAMRRRVIRCSLMLALLLLPLPGFAQNDASPALSLTPIIVPNLPLGVVIFPNGKAINLNVAIGSGAYRQPNDVPGRLWLVTDRGPSLDCADSRRIIGIDPEQPCNGDKTGRLYPLPGFAPSIYGVEIGADQSARITVFLPLKGKSGRPVSGRPPQNPQRPEPVFAMDGKVFPPDPSGIDPEAIVRLSDGTFWIAEEYGPSLLHVAADGTIMKRLVPQGSEGDFRDADYDIIPSLPAVLRLRPTGRGFEGLALSPDEQFLYGMQQGPLANPDQEAYLASRHVRLLKIARDTGEVVARYAYQLEEQQVYGPDQEERERRPLHGQVNDIAAIGPDRLVVLEHGGKATRIFIVTLSEENRLPVFFDQPDYAPGYETMPPERLQARGVVFLPKTPVFNSDTSPGLPARLEAMAVMSPHELILANDNEYGLDGIRTQMFRLTLPKPILK